MILFLGLLGLVGLVVLCGLAAAAIAEVLGATNLAMSVVEVMISLLPWLHMLLLCSCWSRVTTVYLAIETVGIKRHLEQFGAVFAVDVVGTVMTVVSTLFTIVVLFNRPGSGGPRRVTVVDLGVVAFDPKVLLVVAGLLSTVGVLVFVLGFFIGATTETGGYADRAR